MLDVNARVEIALLELTRHFREPLSLAALAAHCDCSPFHFHRQFLKAMGESPMAYLRRIRVMHADHLMVALPKASLLDIALESGFGSAASFSRAYHAVLGSSPSEMRKRALARPPMQGCGLSGLDIQRFPRRQLRAQRCVLDEGVLSAAYMDLAANSTPAQRTALGVFVDAPFHIEPVRCRYYLALDGPNLEGADTIDLEGGEYACVHVTGCIETLEAKLFAFHDQVLLPSPYRLASTVFFERLTLPEPGQPFDYAASKRDVFLRVSRKDVKHLGEQDR